MRPTIARALGIAATFGLVAGATIAGAAPKFVSTETIQFPSGNLVVTFEEGGQKRFSSVDYRLTATADATSCTTVDGVEQCIAERTQPLDIALGLIPEDGRVTGALTLEVNGGPGGTICVCTLHVDYTEVTLTNLMSGRVYRLDPLSADSP